MKAAERRALDLADWIRGRGWVSGQEIGDHLRAQGLSRGKGWAAVAAAVEGGIVDRRPIESTPLAPDGSRYAYRVAQ